MKSGTFQYNSVVPAPLSSLKRKQQSPSEMATFYSPGKNVTRCFSLRSSLLFPSTCPRRLLRTFLMGSSLSKKFARPSLFLSFTMTLLVTVYSTCSVRTNERPRDDLSLYVVRRERGHSAMKGFSLLLPLIDELGWLVEQQLIIIPQSRLGTQSSDSCSTHCFSGGISSNRSSDVGGDKRFLSSSS